MLSRWVAGGKARWRQSMRSQIRHQHEVGTGYFDAVSNAVAQVASSTTALAGSTETAQF